MIYHVIRFTPKPGLSQDQVDAALEKMREANRAMTPPVVRSAVGRDFGGEFEYAAVSVMEDLDAYEEMMNHPAHLEVDRIGLPLVDTFMSFDISDGMDPEVGERIAAIHRRRFESRPDIAELVSDIGEYTGSAAPGRHGTRRAPAAPESGRAGPGRLRR
ncbi:Dabb family protein [Myceligenerans pegani]|uniref:Dabb family protein n=1 Tax=Myceligenerans pegani TaxID=2776917 RepID=A0ABR9N2C6_9MICO|nr:Dabb family protein [Myceligenerans sp. TRM 65318]MBE1877797.1 Dabb family protein [Myceligenerans sp. TRM 65318]MBE3020068.1 Dabb family protein [Myceligenerans sp. TRM 65318]